jgi:hypothetical protein
MGSHSHGHVRRRRSQVIRGQASETNQAEKHLVAYGRAAAPNDLPGKEKSVIRDSVQNGIQTGFYWFGGYVRLAHYTPAWANALGLEGYVGEFTSPVSALLRQVTRRQSTSQIHLLPT